MANKEMAITPKSKVASVLDSYPELESVLIEFVPLFVKLKNPILRKTVAKFTTLQQAAAIGNIKVEDLVNHLRTFVGQDKIMAENTNIYNFNKPEWFDEDKVNKEFDVREMLSRGEHPVNQVIADLNQMKNGEIYKMIAPFLTAPLIDKAIGLGFQNFVDKQAESLYHIYFIKL